jgi:hypothetical protein
LSSMRSWPSSGRFCWTVVETNVVIVVTDCAVVGVMTVVEEGTAAAVGADDGSVATVVPSEETSSLG